MGAELKPTRTLRVCWSCCSLLKYEIMQLCIINILFSYRNLSLYTLLAAECCVGGLEAACSGWPQTFPHGKKKRCSSTLPMLTAGLWAPGPTFPFPFPPHPDPEAGLLPLGSPGVSAWAFFFNPNWKTSYLPLVRFFAGQGLFCWISPVWKGFEFKTKSNQLLNYEKYLGFDT